METQVLAALDRHLDDAARQWLDDALTRIAQHPQAVRAVFPAVGRRCGRAPLLAGWTVADAARARLLGALPLRGTPLAEEVAALYRYGDAAEQRAVLGSLASIEDTDPAYGALGLTLVREALRGNDTRLIEAALGPYAARHLDADGYRHAVLKCVFHSIPLDRITGLDTRADRELARMLGDFAHERVAAGRTVPADIWPVLRTHGAAADASGLAAEAHSPVPERRAAAVLALTAFHATTPTGAARCASSTPTST
ncbi:EboA domain-containing protein [Streptomyces sp. NPDC087212]|uniref:EboA domain-containing protein n=1 Tax=Streptomyces sp. NPDC087212 TaxID=3365766 RepID=UPI0037FC79CF